MFLKDKTKKKQVRYVSTCQCSACNIPDNARTKQSTKIVFSISKTFNHKKSLLSTLNCHLINTYMNHSPALSPVN